VSAGVIDFGIRLLINRPKIIENIGNGIIPHGLSNWLPIAATCIYLLSIPRNFALLYELAAT